MAIFLALAKHYNDPEAVVVLDDVITSVDDVHMERFIQMLHDEGDHFNQIILTTHFEEISNLAWIRNQVGCHFNLAGMSVSDNDVFKLANKTIELTEALVCDTCGELPQSDKSGVYWNCRCKRTRLYPLKQPV